MSDAFSHILFKIKALLNFKRNEKKENTIKSLKRHDFQYSFYVKY